MTTYIIIAMVAGFGGLVLWAAIVAARERGKAEAIAKQAQKDADNAHKAGTVMAEHRTDSDTVDRLQSGRF